MASLVSKPEGKSSRGGGQRPKGKANDQAGGDQMFVCTVTPFTRSIHSIRLSCPIPETRLCPLSFQRRAKPCQQGLIIVFFFFVSQPGRGGVPLVLCGNRTSVALFTFQTEEAERERGLWVQQGWGRARVVCPSVLLFVPPQGKVMVFFHTRVRDNRKRRKRTLTATEEKRKRGTIDQQTPHFVFLLFSVAA